MCLSTFHLSILTYFFYLAVYLSFHPFIHPSIYPLIHPFDSLHQVSVVYGGTNARTQLTQLATGMDILVATPGRLQDFVDRHLVSLHNIQFLILDEADRMLVRANCCLA